MFQDRARALYFFHSLKQIASSPVEKKWGYSSTTYLCGERRQYLTVVLFPFQSYPVCNVGNFINFGVGTVWSESPVKSA